jgi:hypothetical protein
MGLQEHIRGALGKVAAEINAIKQQQAAISAQYKLIEKLCTSNQSITSEIDKLKGRRLFYNLTGTVDFTIADNGRRGTPITLLVSQDGPFIMTHYPFAAWRASAPAGATLFGHWRPVSAWPLPLQATGTGVDLDEDIISLSYEFSDGGSQRNFQNEPVPPVLSRPDNMVPLPVPTLFTPNTSIQIFPTYEAISFSNAATAPTQGTLVMVCPGYRVANM